MIENPKRHADGFSGQEAKLFPYYAGYSSNFAEQLLQSMKLKPDAIVLDPWNGSGTTTSVAQSLGFGAIGFDLNPVMVVVAKAAMLSHSETPSLFSLAKAILEQSEIDNQFEIIRDPLCTWISPTNSEFVRAIERSINRTLVSFDVYKQLSNNLTLESVSPLAAFFYVALFRTVRRILVEFIPTNPTWTKKPSAQKNRKRPSKKTISDFFLNEVTSLSEKLLSVVEKNNDQVVQASVRIGNAEDIQMNSRLIDVIVTSPPYCTRIDYAMATAIELAVLGYSDYEFDRLRRSLTGTSTVERNLDNVNERWGNTCTQFLESVYRHPSKASKTYYFKNHVQYFNSLFLSISEISRVLKVGGQCVLVVQNSHYKEILNDVSGIVCDMAMHHGLSLTRRENFSTTRSMVGLNRNSKKYIPKRVTTESVLCFQLQ